MPAAAESAKGHLDRARLLVRNSMTEARRYVWDLRSQELHKKDLPAALRDTTSRLTADTGIDAVVEVTGPPQPLPVAVETNLLRIGQEAVNNAARHARCTKVTLVFRVSPRRLLLEVADDGIGLDVTAPGDGTGLASMRRRAGRLGATLDIASMPRHGTRVTLTMPLEPVRATDGTASHGR